MRITKNNVHTRKKERGMSLIESVPILMVMATLFGFLFGAWGIAHKHILHSIAARTYAFETFNHRANLMYFNDKRAERNSYEETELRYHAIGSVSPDDFHAYTAPIRLPASGAKNTGSNDLHRTQIWQDDQYKREREINPQGQLSNLNHVWVTVGYGICLNTNCGE